MILTVVVAIAISLAVPLFAIYIVTAFDQFSTARLRTLALCGAWGLVAFGLAYVANTAILELLVAQFGMARADGVDLIRRMMAPLIEETLKAAFLVFLVQQPTFRYAVDGALYGFCIGAGFAVIENVFYISNNPGTAVALAATRSLSTALMHAMATALIGITLGRARRSVRGRAGWIVGGFAIAMIAHIVYNNIVNTLSGTVLLLVAIAIGLGGVGLIIWIMRGDVAREKQSFSAVLDKSAGVAEGERLAIQRIGEQGLSPVIEELSAQVGDENLALIRKMLITQANIGILRNNLAVGNVSPRLREAWEREISEKRQEFEAIRAELGRVVQSYMQQYFPPGDEDMANLLAEQLAAEDPTMINQFDSFMRTSQLAASMSAEDMERLALQLHAIDIFREVSLADLENLARAITSRTFQPGEMLFDQGDDGDAMYLIESGGIDIFSVDNGAERFIRRFEPGSVVGDFAVFDGQKRSARARAAGDRPLVALVLQRETFRMFIQSRPGVIMAVLKVLGEKARFTTLAVSENVSRLRHIASGDFDAIASAKRATADISQAADATVDVESSAGESGVTDALAERLARLAVVLKGQNRPAHDTSHGVQADAT